MTLDTNAVVYTMKKVIDDVIKERFRQIDIHGHQEDNTNSKWLVIALEEFGEIAQALQKDTPAAKYTDADNLYEEIIQAAASLIKWAETIKGYERGVNNG